MERRRLLLIVIPLALAASAAAFGYSVVAERAAPPPMPRKQIPRKLLADACGSRVTYDRLKAQLFEEALDLREGDPRALDLLAGSTVVRVEDPVVQAYDESLGVIVCGGEFILELPPGAADAFDGRHRINARIEYAAQKAADGSGPVYRMRGAEPIIYRLAAFGLPVDADTVHATPAAMPAEATEIAPAEPIPPIVKVPPEEVKEAPALKDVESEVAPKRAEPAKVVKKVEPASIAKTEKAKPKKAAAAKAPAKPVKAAVKEKTAKTVEKKPVVKVKVEKAALKKAIVKPVKVAAKPAQKKTAAPAPAPKKAAAPAPTKAKVLKPAAGQRQAGAAACRASRRSAQILCANPALAAKERRTTSLYYSALENADRNAAALLRRTAGSFNSYLASCDNEACVSQAFDGRTREIRDIMAGTR